MDVSKLKLWTEALRSGEYEQGTGSLHSYGNAYCCLGVACEVAIKDGLDLQQWGDGYSEPSGVVEEMHLPFVVRAWLGLDGYVSAPEVTDPEHGLCSVIAMNDEYNRTFEQIADALEAKYLKGDQ